MFFVTIKVGESYLSVDYTQSLAIKLSQRLTYVVYTLMQYNILIN